MLDGHSPDPANERRYADMAEYMVQFTYRREFGMSYAQFCKEPAGLIIINTMIMMMRNQRLNKESIKKHG